MENLPKILEARLRRSQSKSRAYSQRTLARTLGISSGALSEILRGRRKVSWKVGERIAHRLQLDPLERRTLGLASDGSASQDLQLSADAFHLIADWWHFAILSLLRAPNFRGTPTWIARRVHQPVSRVEQSLALLQRLGLVTRDAAGRLTRTHASFSTTDGIQDLAIQRAHREDLALIDKALSNLPVELRDSTSVTMTLDPNRLPELKRKLRALRDEFMVEAEATPGTEVYRLSMHVFPLTKIEGDTHEMPS